MTDKPLALDQIRPVLYSLHWAADLYEAENKTLALDNQDRKWLQALYMVARALDPEATPAQRVDAKRSLRARIQGLEKLWRLRSAGS